MSQVLPNSFFALHSAPGGWDQWLPVKPDNHGSSQTIIDREGAEVIIVWLWKTTDALFSEESVYLRKFETELLLTVTGRLPSC